MRKQIFLTLLALLSFLSFQPQKANSYQAAELTTAERAWIAGDHTVRVRVVNYPPYQLTKPVPSGIAIDYLSAAAKRYGFKIELVSDEGDFASAVEDVQTSRQRFDLLLTFSRTPEREKQFAITVDYLTAPWVVYARRDSPYIIGLESLDGKTVAAEKGYVIGNKIKADYPAIRILEVPNSADALHAVATGQADAYVGNLANASYLVKANRLDNLVVTAPTRYGINTQAMAIRNDWPELAGVINKGIAAMTLEERNAINYKWGSVEFKPRVDYTLAWQIVVVSSLVLLTFVYWNRKLAREIVLRKEAEKTLLKAQRVALVALADLAENRDTDTGDHVLRVARMTHEIARTLLNKGVEPEVCDENFLQHLGQASILHDVGKVTIPDSILFKPGKLSNEERRIMETHAFGGGTILNKATRMLPDSVGFKLARDIAHYHHENWDASGYPDGLQGREIPLSARIVSVADVFDALISTRPYKKPWTQEAAKEFVRENCGKKFDPVVVEAFFDILQMREHAEIIEWNDNIAIGHPVIDRDHRVLLGLINQITVKQNADDQLAVRFVLDELVSYTFGHFEREEMLMKESGYPDIERHKSIHELMFSEVQRFVSNYDDSNGDISTDLVPFLKRWLTTHIMQTDREYIPFVVRDETAS